MGDPLSGHPRGAPSLRILMWVAVAYFVAGKLGLRLAFLNASASPIWPPTGIAIAALLVLGRRVWPAILVGAFGVNLTTSGNIFTSLGIAFGNTLEAVVGAALTEGFANGRLAFERPRDVFRFAILAGLLSPVVSATIGVTSLWLGGLASPLEYAAVWRTWWLGDAGGALVVAPLVVLWATRGRPGLRPGQVLEAVLLLLALVAVGLLVFGDLLPPLRGHPLLFLAGPLLSWVAIRFDPREAATATAVLAAMAVWGGLRRTLPLSDANDSLLVLAAFLAVSSVSTLVLAAAVCQRRAAEAALARAAAIVDSSEDAIIGKTLEGTITSWSPGAERLYGYPAAEVLGRPVSLLAVDDRADEIPFILERVRRGERVESFETERKRRDGSRVVVSLTLSPIRDSTGRLVGASAIARDITRRKRAERTQAMQFAVTRALAESSALGEAGPRLLEAVCAGLDWDAGEVWSGEAESMKRLATFPWLESGVVGTGEPGCGGALARAALTSGRPVAVADLEQDVAWCEEPAAAAGLHGALAWPLPVDGQPHAALVLLSRQPRPPRQEQFDLMADLATRVSQALERWREAAQLQRLQKAVETIQMGVTITDTRGRILYTNPAEAAMHGRSPQELIGQHVSVFMPSDWKPASGRPEEIRSWRRETVNARRDGTVFPVQLLSDAVAGPDGQPVAVVTCTEEITDRRRAEVALRSSEERYRMLFERNLAGVYRGTLDGRLLECNDAMARILGYTTHEELLALSAAELYVDPHVRARDLGRLLAGGRVSNRELQLRRKDGGLAWVLESQTVVRGDPGDELVEGTVIDITDRKEFEQRIEFQAYHDSLTGLPNRAFLTERLQDRLQDAALLGRSLQVLFLDLDRFKAVNDTLGHAMGDRLLQQVATRLRQCVREDDLVVRMGGDEFVLLLSQIRPADAVSVAKKLLACIEEPVKLDEHELRVTASIGLARFPDDGSDVETLLEHADSAMYRAKDRGRNACQEWRSCAADAPSAGGESDRSWIAGSARPSAR
ncbi:MAG: PAS domain S-box protein [Vicinamibacteria bacterium]|nr:PAS domain S-box protein [Vicinamibacteria bacterium]